MVEIIVVLDCDESCRLLNKDRAKESDLVGSVKKQTSTRIWHSQKGLCISEAYLGYLAGHPVHHEYQNARRA